MGFELAQINIARARAPLDSPAMKEFVDALDRINALAEASPGFVWRFQTAEGNALAVQAFDDPLVIVNLSVWDSVAALRAYAYRSMHGDYFARRQLWFEKMTTPHLALWWVPAGTRPDPAEGRRRLEVLARVGPSAEAFTFQKMFSAPGEKMEAEG